jgi:hypothetical protein
MLAHRSEASTMSRLYKSSERQESFGYGKALWESALCPNNTLNSDVVDSDMDHDSVQMKA